MTRLYMDDPRLTRTETAEPWDLDWASFQYGDAVVDENAAEIVRTTYGLPDGVDEADLWTIWEDLTDSAKYRIVDEFKKRHKDRAREMFNRWYRERGGM